MKDLNDFKEGGNYNADLNIEEVHAFKPNETNEAVMNEGQYLLQIPEGYKAIIKIEKIDG